MKSKLIIENGYTEIILTPENDFETDVIEKICNNKQRFNIETSFKSETSYGIQEKHKISISINKKQKL